MDINIRFVDDHATEAFRVKVINMLETLLEQGKQEMATLDETLAVVTTEDTKVDGIIALATGLEKQVADALAGTTLPPPVQAKIDAVFTQAKASADKIDAALAANVPPTPVA